MMLRRLAVAAAALGCALAFAPNPAGAQSDPPTRLRFVMVTHGAATDSFWAAVKEGADAAAKAMDVELIYRAPATFDLAAMADLLTRAAGERPDGLIVSIPDADALAGAVQAAVGGGIPLISINSGYDVGRSLGALMHVGQSEYEAGQQAGEAMRRMGGTSALCLNHEVGNVALDLRCKGFIDGFGGSVEVMAVPTLPADAGEAIAKRLADEPKLDAVLALNATIAGEPAVAAAKALAGRTVHVGTFDVTAAILEAVADGAAAFAIDQQPFLQGYLPVEYLALYIRRGVIPVGNVATGPRLVTSDEAKRRLGRPIESEPAPAAEPDAAEPADG